MEELWELRRHIRAGDYGAALALLDEMTAEQLAARHDRHQVLHDAWAQIRHTPPE